MHRFTIDEIPHEGESAELAADQSHHLARVLRLKPGERVLLIDGRGMVAEADILQASPRVTSVRVLSRQRDDNRSRIWLCFALPKSGAMDFLIRRCAEVGVRGFQPLETAHSQRARTWNPERWERVVEEVCKQCQSPWFPELRKPATLGQWLADRSADTALVVCDEQTREGQHLSLRQGAEVDLVVGAEGGWSASERETFAAAGAMTFGLGRNRLRAETASLVAAVLLKQQLGEF